MSKYRSACPATGKECEARRLIIKQLDDADSYSQSHPDIRDSASTEVIGLADGVQTAEEILLAPVSCDVDHCSAVQELVKLALSASNFSRL